jgi:hypothetical protein
MNYETITGIIPPISIIYSMTFWVIIVLLYFVYPMISDVISVTNSVFQDIKNKVIIFKTITGDKRGLCRVFCSILKTMITTLVNLTKQRFLRNVEKIKNKKNLYRITFAIGGRTYQLLVKHNPCPTDLLQVTDNETKIEITEQIEPIYNCKRIELNPRVKDLGYNNISLLTSDGNEISLKDEDGLFDNPEEELSRNGTASPSDLDAEILEEIQELEKNVKKDQ